MLRLTLSEHFMSAANLLGQIDSARTSPKPPVKKKPVESVKTEKSDVDAELFNSQNNTQPPSPSVPQPVLQDTPTLESVKQNWQNIIDTVKLQSPAAAGFLASASPVNFNNNVLTLSFPASARLALDICQKKSDRLSSAFSVALNTNVRLKFEADSQNLNNKPSRVPGARMAQKEKNKAMSDPDVQTFLKALDATLVDIEKVKKD